LASLLAAPAVVRAEVLMPVSVWRPTLQKISRPNFVHTRAFGQDLFVCSVERLIGCEDWALVESPRFASESRTHCCLSQATSSFTTVAGQGWLAGQIALSGCVV
jgi:hypothetical protein